MVLVSYNPKGKPRIARFPIIPSKRIVFYKGVLQILFDLKFYQTQQVNIYKVLETSDELTNSGSLVCPPSVIKRLNSVEACLHCYGSDTILACLRVVSPYRTLLWS